MALLPLSIPQKEVWTEWLAWSESEHLNIGGHTDLEGPLDKTLLKEALTLLVKENSALRLIPQKSGMQKLSESFSVQLEFKDFSDCDDPKREARLWQQHWMSVRFESEHHTPVRFAILKRSEHDHSLVIQALHTIMDGWSLSITPRRWAECYNRLLAGKEHEKPNSRDYLDYIEESQGYLSSKQFEKDKCFWKEAFSRLPEPLFVERYGQSNSASGELALAHISNHHVDDNIRNSIRQFAQEHKVTAFQIYLSILALYFTETLNSEELVVGVPNLNRSGNKYKNTLGMFVTVLPITISYKKGQSFLDLVKHVGTLLKASYRHAKYPMSEHAKRLEVVRSGRDRIFDIVFSYEEFEFTTNFGEANLSGTKQTFNPHSRYPLAISLCDFLDAKDTEMVIESGSHYFSSVEGELLGQRFLHIASQLLCETKDVSELSYCTPTELALMHKQVERQTASIDTEPYFQSIINNSLVAPKNIALKTADAEITYQQMIVAAGNLADILKNSEVQKGDTVILALSRGPEVVVSMIACSFIGATFLPIDLEWPSSRVRNIHQQTNCKAYCVNKNSERLTDYDGPLIDVDIESLMAESYSLSNLAHYNKVSHSVAYILFTSGSTGQPKGVRVSHIALKNRLNWIVEDWQVTSADTSLQATQINFDPALVELLVPLLVGGTVAFPQPGRLLPEWLPELIVDFNATMMAFVPSTLTRFLDGMAPNQNIPLRICCCGGEVLPIETAQRFIQQTKSQLYNVYGPTEASIFCTAWQVQTGKLNNRSLPVGKGLSNTQLFILNNKHQVQPFGVVGEIYVGGVGLADNYVKNEIETASKFKSIDIPGLGLQRLYKTGDLGWMDSDNILHFSGRKDRQIKLRGYRIELNEIESAIMSIPGIDQAACQLVTDTTSGAIHAWYSSKKSILTTDVRAHLTYLLPDYMVPQKLLGMLELPLSSTNKINYRELPAITSVEHHAIARAPIGDLEKQLLKLWRSALKDQNLHVNSHFFESGGDSLSAVMLLNESEKLIGSKLSLHQLVSHPTVASLAESISNQLHRPNLLISMGDTTREASLYVAASGNGDLLRFKSLARCIKGVSDLHMLQPPGTKEPISIKELAALYADKIIERGDKSIYLAGFSVGGLVAVETAQILRTRDFDVKTVFVVDTILLKMPRFITWLWGAASRVLGKWHIARQRSNGSKTLSAIQDKGLLMQVKAMRTHKLSPYEGDAIIIKSSAYRFIHGLLLGGWKKILTGRLVEVEIETSHSRFFEPGKVDELADVIKQEVQKKDG